MSAPIVQLLSPADIPLVGRERETEALLKALGSAKSGKGATWTLEGPVGIGKTRLTKWLEDRARELGFAVNSAMCLNESISPLFPWKQIFRGSMTKEGAQARGRQGLDSAFLLLEVEQGPSLGKWLEESSPESEVMFVARDKPSTIRDRHPGLPKGVEMLWLTRVSGESTVYPAHLDVLSEKLEAFLGKGPGRVVALEGLEYLVSQSNFSGVFNFLQVLRDLAQEVDGHVVISFRPSAFDRREVSLLETLGDVSKEEKLEAEKPLEVESEALSNVMLRYLDYIEGSASNKPSLVIIEDIQWADPPSLKVLQFLARNIREIPVFIVGTVRTELGGRPSPSDPQPGQDAEAFGVIENMVDEGCLQRMELTGLRQEDRLSVAEKVVGAPIVVQGGATEFESFLERTDGNPYLIISTMQMLAEDGRIVRKGDLALIELAKPGKRGEEAFSFPQSVRVAARERMRGLTDEEQSILTMASISGQEFSVSTIAAALGYSPGVVLDACQRLEWGKGFLVHTPGEEDTWHFANPVTMEAARSISPPQRQEEFSRALARWWEKNRPGDVEMIARLFFEAGEFKDGVPWVRKALDDTLINGSPEMVLKLHRWLQEMLGENGVSTEARAKEGLDIVSRLVARHGPSLVYIRLLEDLQEIGAPFPLPELIENRIIRALASMNTSKGEEHLMTMLNKYSKGFETLPHELQMSILLSRVEVLAWKGHYEKMAEAADQALAMMTPDERPNTRVTMLRWRSVGLIEKGRLDEARSCLEEAKHVVGVDDFTAISLRTVEAGLNGVTGRLATAAAMFRINGETSMRMGRVFSCAVYLYNSALMEAALGDVRAARKTMAEDRLLITRFGRTERLDTLSYLEGEILLAEGKWEEGILVLKRLFTSTEALNLAEDLPQTGLALAECYLHVGEADNAFQTLEQVEKGESKVQMVSLPRFYRVKGVAAATLGRHEEARQLLEKSVEVATRITNTLERGLTRLEEATLEDHMGNKAEAERLRRGAKVDLEDSELPPDMVPRKLIGLSAR